MARVKNSSLQKILIGNEFNMRGCGCQGMIEIGIGCSYLMLHQLMLYYSHGYVLTPGRYVGAEDVEDDGEPFDEKVKRLTIKLDEQFRESAQLEQAIRENLRRLKQ